jgi:hypothetical protein
MRFRPHARCNWLSINSNTKFYTNLFSRFDEKKNWGTWIEKKSPIILPFLAFFYIIIEAKTRVNSKIFGSNSQKLRGSQEKFPVRKVKENSSQIWTHRSKSTLFLAIRPTGLPGKSPTARYA